MQIVNSKKIPKTTVWNYDSLVAEYKKLSFVPKFIFCNIDHYLQILSDPKSVNFLVPNIVTTVVLTGYYANIDICGINLEIHVNKKHTDLTFLT